jgi:hypothetical protein
MLLGNVFVKLAVKAKCKSFDGFVEKPHEMLLVVNVNLRGYPIF